MRTGRVLLLCLMGVGLLDGTAVLGNYRGLPLPVGLGMGKDAKGRFNLPIGWQVVNDFEASAEQVKGIGDKLGANLVSVSNTVLSASGVRLQVNMIECGSAKDAEVVGKAILQTKGDPAFCLVLGSKVVEFVGSDAGLATKAAFELGFKPKPAAVRYQITFDASPVEGGDYMSWNAMYQAFVGLSQGDAAASGKIAELRGKLTFGNQLRFRYYNPDGTKIGYEFRPGLVKAGVDPCGDVVVVDFDKLPVKEGIGMVTVRAVVGTSRGGMMKTNRSRTDAALLRATEFWPCEDGEVVKLAEKITAGCSDDGAKVNALLRWLRPGANIRFGGPVTGSRYGVKQVLEQKYGHCWDFSDCFVTLCRAVKIPCRQLGGWLYGAEGHVWAEVLLADGKWYQVDPTGGGVPVCGIYHIAYLTSEDGRMPLVYLSKPEIVMLDE